MSIYHLCFLPRYYACVVPRRRDPQNMPDRRWGGGSTKLLLCHFNTCTAPTTSKSRSVRICLRPPQQQHDHCGVAVYKGVEDFNNTSALGGKWESQASLHISSSWLEISKRSKHIDHPWYWNIFFGPKGKFWGTHTGRKVTGSSKESCPVYPSGLLPCMLQLMSTKRQLQSLY